MPRLTDAQKRVLRVLAEGGRLIFTPCGEAITIAAVGAYASKVRTSTCRALEKSGLLEYAPFQPNTRTELLLTDAGRRALEEADAH